MAEFCLRCIVIFGLLCRGSAYLGGFLAALRQTKIVNVSSLMPSSSSSSSGSSSSSRSNNSSSIRTNNAQVLPLTAAATGNPLLTNKSLFKRLELETDGSSFRTTAYPGLSPLRPLAQGNDEVGHTCCSSLMGRGLPYIGGAFVALVRALSGAAQYILACRMSITVRFDTLVSLVMFYVLLMDIIRLAVPKKYDPFLFGATLAALLVLSLDFILMLMAHTQCSGARSGGSEGFRCLTITGYALSFRFWLDVCVLLSVILSACGVDGKVRAYANSSMNSMHVSNIAQSVRLIGPSVVLNTLHKFRLFRVIDRHVIPNDCWKAVSSDPSSLASSPGPSSSSIPRSSTTPTVRSFQHQNIHQQQLQQPTSILSAGLAWVRREGTHRGIDNSSSEKRSSRTSLLPQPSISFVGRDPRAYDGGGRISDIRNSSRGGSNGTGGGGRRGGGGGGGNGKPLEAELYNLIMHRLILTLSGALLMLAFLNSNHARFDQALPAATAMLHAVQAKDDDGKMAKVVLTSYLNYFGGEMRGRGGGMLLSLQLGVNQETAPFLIHDASRLAILRDTEIYRLQLVSFPPSPSSPVPSLEPLPTLPVAGGGEVGVEGPELDDVPSWGRSWVEEGENRQWHEQRQLNQQRNLASNNATQPIAFTAAVFDVSLAYRQRILLEEFYLPVFLAALLVLGAHAFSKDTRRLIVSPIDWIIQLVQKLAEDPLGEFELEAPNSSQANTIRHAQYETALIAASLKKITRLLRVGFGIAGADIISHNLDMNKPQAILNPLLPGKRVMAIMGFCDIHHFDFIVKHLEAEAMTFVNQVAAIVHENVSLWKGVCNKNLGNSFLLMWRIGDEEKLLSVSRSFLSSAGSGSSSKLGPATAGGGSNLTHLDVRRIPGVEALADQALLGFLKILVALKRDKKLQSLCNDPRLHGKDGEPFELHMRFGLHAGWAIEGAVGSRHKVDATYLSPHVNMAARMETAATQYGVPVLMTDSFYQILSTHPRKRCRKLDVITVKGSATPRSIYTFDAHPGPLSDFPSRSAFKTYSADIWKKDKDILYLQESAAGADQFRSTFEVGLTNYINGLWVQAAECFRACDAMMEQVGGDGPSRTLLRYMQERDFKCPENWQGFRPLTSK